MNKIDKAKHFVLLGYGGKYTRKAFGIARQTIVDRFHITSDDIIQYQINWIKDHYDEETILQEITKSLYVENLPRVKQRRELEVMGCRFGNSIPVFTYLIGKEKYDEIDKEARRVKRENTLIKNFGCVGVNSLPDIKKKMRATFEDTMMKKYGVKNPTEIPEVAALVHKNRQETMLKKYGAKNSVQIKQIQDKIQVSKGENMSMSQAERQVYDLLKPIFPDICYNVRVDERYPFFVDFYIPSRDLFIEINFDKSHYTHWYDESNVSDRHVVESWEQNAQRRERETGQVSRYRRCINTWTKFDVEKRMRAKANALNYLVFWDGRRSGSTYTLPEVHDWIEQGCPDSVNYHNANTY